MTCLSCCDTNIKLEELGEAVTSTALLLVPPDSSHTNNRPCFGKANKSSPKLSKPHWRSGSVSESALAAAGWFQARAPVIDTPAL